MPEERAVRVAVDISPRMEVWSFEAPWARTLVTSRRLRDRFTGFVAARLTILPLVCQGPSLSWMRGAWDALAGPLDIPALRTFFGALLWAPVLAWSEHGRM